MTVAVHLATPGHPHVGPLLVIAPALAAVRLGPRLIVLTGVLALMCQVAIAMLQRDLSSADRVAQLLALIGVSGFAAVMSAGRERSARELRRVSQVCETAQELVLQPLPPRIGPLHVAAVYLSAENEMHIGGDLYAAARIKRGTRLIVGDVRGKGLAAVGDAALLMGAFRAVAHLPMTLAQLTAHLDTSVCGRQAELAAPDHQAHECFITAVLLEIPDHPAAARIAYCGHPPPLLLRPGHTAAALSPRLPGPPLGLDIGTPCYDVDTFDFGAGDLLLLYTDGVIEARNTRGEFYPLLERAAWRGERPEDFLERLRTDLLAHAGGRLDDDAAMIAIERPAELIRHGHGNLRRDRPANLSSWPGVERDSKCLHVSQFGGHPRACGHGPDTAEQSPPRLRTIEKPPIFCPSNSAVDRTVIPFDTGDRVVGQFRRGRRAESECPRFRPAAGRVGARRLR
ncbi:PP2C family protein-serine/threonine phosphatase [Streptomyces nodosus]